MRPCSDILIPVQGIRPLRNKPLLGMSDRHENLFVLTVMQFLAARVSNRSQSTGSPTRKTPRHKLFNRKGWIFAKEAPESRNT